MSTGAVYTNIEPKKLMGTVDFGERMLAHMRELVRENSERVWDEDVVHGTQLTLAADGANKFQIQGSALASDGQGRILDVANAAVKDDIQFENTISTPYYVGLKYAIIPDGVRVNTRTGWPEYEAWKEEIGQEADPDSVTNLGSTLRFLVDSVTEAGVSNAGRKVLVYKNSPGKNATTEALAIEECTVVWSGGQNIIETSGLLGQETVSTTAADYTVVLLGPVVKRNTDLRLQAGNAFLGIITGAGAGSPPSVFDHSDQEVTVASLSKLHHITRVASNGRLKIDVKPITGETNEKQIISRDPSGAIKFWVDEQGNVKIEGDLEVTGQTTQQDVVQVNSSETITDNLTAGDNVSSDSHLIKGTWRHTDGAGAANYFKVDGSTGRVGIWADPTVSDRALLVGGKSQFNAEAILNSVAPSMWYRETDQTVDAGGLWRTLVSSTLFAIDENTAAGGDFTTSNRWFEINRASNLITTRGHIIPQSDDAYDLGGPTQQWKNMYLDGTLYADKLSIDDSAGEGLATNLVPTVDDARNLGSASYRYSNIYARTIHLDGTAGYGVGSDVTPTADNTYSIGSASRRWSSIYVYNLNFTGDFLPQTDNTQNIGSAALKWATMYSNFLKIGDNPFVNGDSGISSREEMDNTTGVAYGNYYKCDIVAPSGTAEFNCNTFHAEVTSDYNGVDGVLNVVSVMTDVSGQGGSEWDEINLINIIPQETDYNVDIHRAIKIQQPDIVGGCNENIGIDIGAFTGGDILNYGIRSAAPSLFQNTTTARGIVPETTSTYSLGTSSLLWNAHINEATFYSSVNPYDDVAIALGTNSKRWAEVCLDDLRITGKVAGSLLPFSDDTYDLGSASYEWRNLYVDGVAYLDQINVNAVGGHLVPNATTYNLGSTANWWQIAYANQFTIVKNSSYRAQAIKIAGYTPSNASSVSVQVQGNHEMFIGSGESCDTLVSNSGYTDLEDMHICSDSNIYFWSGLQSYAATDRHMTLSSDGKLSIGFQDVGDAYLHIGRRDSGVTTRGDLICAIWPTGTMSSTAGTRYILTSFGGNVSNAAFFNTALYRHTTGSDWDSVGMELSYSVDSSINAGGTIRLDRYTIWMSEKLFPISTDTFDLGSASYFWRYAYAQRYYIDNTTSFWYSPSTSFVRLYISGATALTIGESGDASDLFSELSSMTHWPRANNTYDIGSSGNYWRYLFVNNLRYKTVATFDTADDLALIDAFEPTEEFIEVEKGGQKYQVQKADQNKIPWPMLAERARKKKANAPERDLPTSPNKHPEDYEDDEDWFIDGGDSVFFLLGAIRQLHGKHKALLTEHEALQQRVAALEA